MYLPVRAIPLNSSVNMKLETKSLTEATVDMTFFRLFPDVVRGLHPGTDDHQPDQCQRDEYLPAQTHDLVVTVAREGGANPQKYCDHHERFDAEPDPARNPVEKYVVNRL